MSDPKHGAASGEVPGFTTASCELPADHWSTQPGQNTPPMGLRAGTQNTSRKVLEVKVVKAVRYAYRAATMNGTASLDPDSLVQNAVVGLLGYFTPDGLSSDEHDNPSWYPGQFCLEDEKIKQAAPAPKCREITFAIVKPDAYPYADKILKQAATWGLSCRAKVDLTLTPEQVAALYPGNDAAPWWPAHRDFMVSGPSCLLVFEGIDAVSVWRQLCGPTNPELAKAQPGNCLRKLFGSKLPRNAVHGSDSPAEVIREMAIFEPTVAFLTTSS